MKELVERIKGKTVFITGSAKNAGKTTLLNYLLRGLRAQTPLLLTSIGVDGEPRDLVFEHPKPLITVEQGDFVLTTDSAIKSSSAICKIIEVFPTTTVLGRIVFAEILRGDYIELVGVETNSQLNAFLEKIETNYGKKTVLVDGAVNRITQACVRPGAGIIDVIKVTPLSYSAARERLKFLSWVLNNYKSHSLSSEEVLSLPNSYALDGALTSGKLKTIPEGTETVILNDFTSIFLDFISLSRMKFKIVFRNLKEIYGIILICQGVDETDFLSSLKDLAIDNVLYLNPYKEYLR